MDFSLHERSHFPRKLRKKNWNTCIKVFYSFNELLHSKTTGGVKSKRHKTLQLIIRTNLRQLWYYPLIYLLLEYLGNWIYLIILNYIFFWVSNLRVSSNFLLIEMLKCFCAYLQKSLIKYYKCIITEYFFNYLKKKSDRVYLILYQPNICIS